VNCCHSQCPNTAEEGKDECFRHRVLGVGFAFQGSANPGRSGWNRTAREWREEHLGTNDERELAKRGIVRASDYGW
jgi:hypothetical protein